MHKEGVCSPLCVDPAVGLVTGGRTGWSLWTAELELADLGY